MHLTTSTYFCYLMACIMQNSHYFYFFKSGLNISLGWHNKLYHGPYSIRAVATSTVGTVFTRPLSAELTVLCINVTRSRHSRGIYNCGAMPLSVYVYLEREASTIAWFPICSSSCSFTPRNCFRNDIRKPRIEKFPGGACPQTPK